MLLATGESRVLSILLFTMFEQGQVTVVAAIGVLMIATLLIIVAIFYKLTGKWASKHRRSSDQPLNRAKR